MWHYITLIKDWIIGLGEKHGVDPLLLGCLYLVSKLSLVIFLGLVVKNLRVKKPILIPLLCASVSFCVPYVYLIIAGRDISVWVYVFVSLVFIYGGFTIRKTVMQKSVKVDTLLMCLALVNQLCDN